jgi:endogenous inhibitor of DNA gyrase (YacG/DUF329 family)
MARKVNTTLTSAEQNAARPFIILRDEDFGRWADLDEAISAAQKGHEADPDSTFIVCRILATVEPITNSKVTRHRL